MVLFKGSRYEKVATFTPSESGGPGFRGLRPRPVGNPEAVVEHTVAVKNRLDQLGHHYYSRSTEWHRIAEANPDFIFPEDILHELEPPAEASPAEKAKLRDELEADSGVERIGATILIPRRERLT